MPTLADLFGKGIEAGLKAEDHPYDELAKKKAEANKPHQKYEKGTMVGKDGKAYDYLIDKTTGEAVDIKPSAGFGTQGFQHGYAPRVDPSTGLVLPASTTENIGLKQLGIGSQPPAQAQATSQPTGAPGSALGQPPAQPQVPMQAKPPTQALPPAQQYTPVQKKGLESAIDNVRQIPGYKEAMQAMQQTGMTREILKESYSNPIAASQVGAMVAKMMEPGGRLTDEDVVRYTRDKSLPGRIRQSYNSLVSGTYSQKDIDLIGRTLDLAEQKERDVLTNLSSGAAQQLEQIHGIPSNQGIKVMLPGGYLPPKPKKQMKSLNDLSPTKGKKPISEMTDEEIKAELGQ